MGGPGVACRVGIVSLREVANLRRRGIELNSAIRVVSGRFAPILGMRTQVVRVERSLDGPRGARVVLKGFLPVFASLTDHLGTIRDGLSKEAKV